MNTERDALAAHYFQKQWEAAQAVGKSKKRNQLRKAAENLQTKEELRSKGASCANCSCFGTAQLGRNLATICELDSDFYGYALTEPEYLCHRWKQKLKHNVKEGEPA